MNTTVCEYLSACRTTCDKTCSSPELLDALCVDDEPDDDDDDGSALLEDVDALLDASDSLDAVLTLLVLSDADELDVEPLLADDAVLTDDALVLEDDWLDGVLLLELMLAVDDEDDTDNVLLDDDELRVLDEDDADAVLELEELLADCVLSLDSDDVLLASTVDDDELLADDELLDDDDAELAVLADDVLLTSTVLDELLELDALDAVDDDDVDAELVLLLELLL